MGPPNARAPTRIKRSANVLGRKMLFRSYIVKWYRLNGRFDLPWRRKPTAWRVLIATVLLRKTTVAQVVRIFDDFLRRYPSPASLARSREAEVTRRLRSLGIESVRANQLRALARKIVRERGGEVPAMRKDLLGLPGIGNYAAAEVRLLAFHEPEAMVDTNTVRVISRVFGVKQTRSRPETDLKMWDLANSIVRLEPGTSAEFNLGILDFASAVCRPRNPRCTVCGIRGFCEYYRRSKLER